MEKKKFSGSFDEVLSRAYVFQMGFEENKAEFTAFSSLFDDPFSANFLVDIEAADVLPIFTNDSGKQAGLTIAVYRKIKECCQYFQRLMLYVGLAFPGDEAVAEAFGASNYLPARNSRLKLIALLQVAYMLANSADYKADLIAIGFLQADIDRLDALAGELTAAINAQTDFISKSFLRTQTRIEAFNKVWESMAMISNASKMIFRESPGLVEFFRLYP